MISNTIQTYFTGVLITSANQWWITLAFSRDGCKDKLPHGMPAKESLHLDSIRKEARNGA
jgi:hypothetical protein